MTDKITIRKSVKSGLSKEIPMLLEDVLSWMKTKYPIVNFDNIVYIFSDGYNRSRYFRNHLNEKHLVPCVTISVRGELMLYNKKSLGIKKNILWVGREMQIKCALIHELTHHVQYETNVRKGNELDTTFNELEYLKQNDFENYKKIIT